MSHKLSLFICLFISSNLLTGQTNELAIEQLKTAVNIAQVHEGQNKALTLALMGYDYLAPDNIDLQQLLFETYYNTSAEEEYYEEEYTELTFNTSDWSPNGQLLAVGLTDGSIRLYNSPFTAYKTLLTNDGQGILDVDFAPDGKSLAYADINGHVKIVNIITTSSVRVWEHDDYIRSIQWSHDGKKIAAGGDENMLYVYDSQSGEKLHSFSGHTDWIRNVSWSANDQFIASASDDATAIVWSLKANTMVQKHSDHEDYCRDVAFAPKGQALISSSDDLSIYFYNNAEDSSPAKDLGGHEDWIIAMDWSKDGKYIATADNGGTIILHNTKNDEKTYYNSVTLETAWTDIDFSSNGVQFAATSIEEITVYKTGESQPISRIFIEAVQTNTTNEKAAFADILNTKLPSAIQLSFSPDKTKLGIINAEYQVEVVDMKSGQELYTIIDHEDWVRNIAWSANSQYLATASDDMFAGIWNANTGEMIQMLSGHEDWVRDVDFAPDSKTLLTAGDDGIIRAWDVSTGDELSATDKLETYIMTVNWSSGQTYFASQDSEGILSIWQSSNNKLVFKSDNNTQEGSVKWTDDKNLLVISQDGETFNWNAVEGITKNNHTAGIKSSKGVMATAKGPYISISGADQSAFLEGHSHPVLGMEWSPDGNYLISYSSDNRMGIWAPAEGKLLAMIYTLSSFNKEVIWLSDNKSLFVAGSPLISLPVSSIRQIIEDTDMVYELTKEDVISYDLEKIFLSNETTAQLIREKAAPYILIAFADFYAQRAKARKEGATRNADQTKAQLFRTAAENR